MFRSQHLYIETIKMSYRLHCKGKTRLPQWKSRWRWINWLVFVATCLLCLPVVHSWIGNICRTRQKLYATGNSNPNSFVFATTPWGTPRFKMKVRGVCQNGEVVVRKSSIKKGVLKNFAKFTRKRLYQNHFLNKVAGLGLQLY